MTLPLAEAARQLSPKARPEYLVGLSTCEPQLLEMGITTPLRKTNFLCQVMGETGGLTILQESGAYSTPRIIEIFGAGNHSAAVTAAEARRIGALPIAQRGPALFERVYGLGNPYKARELGNTQAGDGWYFRGIGPLQSTGRGAAKRWGERCAANFEDDVLLMLAPRYIMLPPLLEWDAGSLNSFADHDDVRRIRRVINGGYNGIADVQEWHDRIWKIMRKDESESWQNAIPLLSTAELQLALNELGYRPKLEDDGRYGPKTTAAVKWFQKIAQLKVDGVAGPVTEAAIKLRLEAFHLSNQGVRHAA